MKVYVNKSGKSGSKRIALDDMILTTELPTTAGSKMLENYMSLFEAEAVSRLTQAGYEISGKVNVGCKHFSAANDYLASIGKEPIRW